MGRREARRPSFRTVTRIPEDGPLRRTPIRFTSADIATILRDDRAQRELPQAFGPNRLISFLTDIGRLREVPLHSDFGNVRRFVWGDASPYSIALSLRPGAYLSHASAMFLHGLTDDVPKVIYVNKEQSPNPPPGDGLTEQALDHAFQNAQRASKYVYTFDSYQAVILNGKHSVRLWRSAKCQRPRAQVNHST